MEDHTLIEPFCSFIYVQNQNFIFSAILSIMTKKILLPLILIGIAVASYYYFFAPSANTTSTEQISVQVKKDDFKINVSATGELKAKNSEKIRGPQSMRSAGIWNTTISDLITEGTVVNEGDYVATLDRTEVDNKIKDALSELEKVQTQLEQAKIDTAIDLRGIRDQLVNMKFSMKEKELEVEQSKYEPEMVIQQAEIDLTRTKRDYTQLESKLDLKKEQAVAKIAEIDAQLKQLQNKLNVLQTLKKDFVVKAPKSGMVIYSRSWNGEKKGPGSQISGWDPVVAELPDLSDMISKTYVNEVDISRVKKGQEVDVKIDAFPDNQYTGKVIKVANIGEQLRGFDSKVFEVVIQVNEPDSILRPAMTTAVDIQTDLFEEVLSIPLDALHTDSISFVYRKKEDGNITKQEIVTSLSNNDKIMVDYGLSDKDEILLSIPDNANDLSFTYLEKAIKDEIQQKQEEAAKKREAAMLEKMKSVKDENISGDSENGDFIIIMN